MTGTCTGLDMMYDWGVHGGAINTAAASPPGSGAPPAGVRGTAFIYPWTSVDITIRAVEVTKLPTTPAPMKSGSMPAYSFLTVGNNASGDAMLFVDAEHIHDRHDNPAGSRFEFPGTKDGDATTCMDLHGGCPSGKFANVMRTFYYTLNQ